MIEPSTNPHYNFQDLTKNQNHGDSPKMNPEPIGYGTDADNIRDALRTHGSLAKTTQKDTAWVPTPAKPIAKAPSKPVDAMKATECHPTPIEATEFNTAQLNGPADDMPETDAKSLDELKKPAR